MMRMQPKMMTTVDIRTMSDSSLAAGSAGPRTVTIDRASETGGYGLGFNGGELLLAIGGCYRNDSSRKAGKRRITVRNVQDGFAPTGRVSQCAHKIFHSTSPSKPLRGSKTCWI